MRLGAFRQNVFGRTGEAAEQGRNAGGHSPGRGVEIGRRTATKGTAHDGAQVEGLLRLAVVSGRSGIGAARRSTDILRRVRQVHVRFFALQGGQVQTAGQRPLHGPVPQRKRTRDEETGNRFELSERRSSTAKTVVPLFTIVVCTKSITE